MANAIIVDSIRKLPRTKKWMMFVDGENLTIRAQKLAEHQGSKLRKSDNWMQNTYFWFEGFRPESLVVGLLIPDLQQYPLRSYYYTVVTGDEPLRAQVTRHLWTVGFSPSVFRKGKEDKTKGVDIAMATDMLSHAFMGNYDVAVLVAGDKDYLPMVESVKRLGKLVIVAFFEEKGHGLSEDLKLAADCFISLDKDLKRSFDSAS